MATITIENVPENIVKLYGTKIIYDNIKTSFLPRKRELNKLKGLSKEEIEKDPTIRLQKLMEDPKNTSYGPMSVDDFISEMKKW